MKLNGVEYDLHGKGTTFVESKKKRMNISKVKIPIQTQTFVTKKRSVQTHNLSLKSIIYKLLQLFFIFILIEIMIEFFNQTF